MTSMPRPPHRHVLLLTAFEPFGDSAVNPSQRVLEVIEGEGIDGVELRPLLLPVIGGVATRRLVAAIRRLRPDVVVSLGESGRVSAITVERIAVNLRDYPIADNVGRRVRERPVVRGGPDAIFATLPVRAIVAAIERAGVPAAVSSSAGTFLCNEVMYAALHATRDTATRTGFIHVPRLPEQVVGTGERGGASPSMAAKVTIKGVRAALDVLAGPRGGR